MNVSRTRIRSAMLIMVLVLWVHLIYGQKIDSLTSLLKWKSGVERHDILYALAYELVDIDNATALTYAKLAFKEAKENSDSLRIVQSGRILSLAYRRLSEIDSSIIISNQVLPIAKRNNDSKELKLILNGLALAYTLKAYYDKALRCYFESLDLEVHSDDEDSNGSTLNNIGLTYYKMKDYRKALSYYYQALNLQDQITQKDNISTFLSNISLCHSHLKNFAEARRSVTAAADRCGVDCPDFVVLQIKYCWGVINFESNQFLSAEPEFLESYAIAKKLNNRRIQLDNMVYLSKIYIKLNKLKHAERYLKETEELIKSGIPYNLELIKMYKEFFNLNMKFGNFRDASEYLQKYTQLKDSIYNEELTKNLMKVEADFLERENTAKIISQSKIMALNDEIIFRQRIINACIIVLTFLLTAIIFILMKRNRYKKKMNRLLELRVKERTVELEQNQVVLHAAIVEQAAFLERVSTEVKSSLASVKGLCSLGLIDISETEVKTYFKRIINTSDQLLDTVNITKKDVNV